MRRNHDHKNKTKQNLFHVEDKTTANKPGYFFVLSSACHNYILQIQLYWFPMKLCNQFYNNLKWGNLSIYDMMGLLIETINDNGHLAAGNTEQEFKK